MALDIEEFIPDAELTEDGIWVDLDEETKILVTYLPADFIQSEIIRRQRKQNIRNPHLLERPEYLRSIEDDGIRKSIKGWQGLRKGGQDWPFSPENLEFIIRHAPDFRAAFLRIVQNASNFTKRQAEEDRKTHGTPPMAVGPPTPLGRVLA